LCGADTLVRQDVEQKGLRAGVPARHADAAARVVPTANARMVALFSGARRLPSSCVWSQLADSGSNGTADAPIDVLHEEITHCRVCQTQVVGFQKPPRLDRGQPGKVMIVGQGPGSAELQGTRAFAGQSGRTLDSWLIACGNNSENPRAGVYFTSVLKCVGPDNAFNVMASNCAHFLQRQISEIRPALVITLGKRSYEALRTSEAGYEEALCRPVDTAQDLLLTPFGFHYVLLHWPHPSGLNRWLNLPQNKERLRESFHYVETFIRGTN
jgi:uracil-DNA glycosylase family 4